MAQLHADGRAGVGFAALIGRAAYLQGFHREFLQEQGDARYSRTLTLPANRGMILDRNGEPLAISTPVQSIWASPSEMDAAVETAGADAGEDARRQSRLKSRKTRRQKRNFIYLARFSRRWPTRSSRQAARYFQAGRISPRAPAGEVIAHGRRHRHRRHGPGRH